MKPTFKVFRVYGVNPEEASVVYSTPFFSDALTAQAAANAATFSREHYILAFEDLPYADAIPVDGIAKKEAPPIDAEPYRCQRCGIKWFEPPPPTVIDGDRFCAHCAGRILGR